MKNLQKLKVLFLVVSTPEKQSPVDYYRAFLPAKFSRHEFRIIRGLNVRYFKSSPDRKNCDSYEADLEPVEWADVVIFSRLYKYADCELMAERAFELGKTVLYQTDDNLLNIWEGTGDQEEIDAYKIHMDFVNRLLPHVHGIITTTEELANVYRKEYNRKTYAIPNAVDIKEWSMYPSEKSKKIKIGWYGGRFHIYAGEEIKNQLEEALLNIYKKYGDKIEYVFMGYDPGFNGFPYRVEKQVGLLHFIQKLTNIGYDIGLAPLTDTKFNRCKSNLKWLEFAMLGAPVLASDVSQYRNLPLLICKTSKDWFNNLDRLISDTDYRKQLGLTAKKWAIKNYSIQTMVERWDNRIDEAYKTSKSNINN